MLRASWGEGRRGAVVRIAADRGLQLVEWGPLAIAGDALDVAAAGTVHCVVVGRLVGVAPAARARHVLDRHAHHGLAALGELDGAYVIFISDGARAWAVRDRLGARTLCHHSTGADVALGEHEADVLELLPATPAPDRMAVVQWIERRSLPEGRSLFSGLRRLPAGHRLELTPAGATERVYWQPAYTGVDRGARTDLAASLRNETFAAIARAREGARAPALRLSGGLDSATVAAGLVHTDGPPVRALATTFPLNPDADESALIEVTARFSGLQLTTLPFRDGELLAPMLRHMRRWKVPALALNLLIWEPVWEVARDFGIDMLLDGEGGDELFGASKYLIADCLRSGRPDRAWRLAGSLPGAGEQVSWRWRARALRSIGVSGALPTWLQGARRRLRPREHLVSPLVRRTDIETLFAQDDPWSFKRRQGPLWWRAMVESRMDSLDALDVSAFCRRQAAEGGIEQRQPFQHDVGLFERVLRTPPQTAFDATRDRALLRDALTGYVADEIRTRHAKSYFPNVTVSRMSGAEGERLAAVLSAPDAPVRHYLDGGGLDAMLEPGSRSAGLTPLRASQLLNVGLINEWLLLLEDPARWAAEREI
jgi:asparagine synthase (glutamine-hydrolysing)